MKFCHVFAIWVNFVQLDGVLGKIQLLELSVCINSPHALKL